MRTFLCLTVAFFVLGPTSGCHAGILFFSSKKQQKYWRCVKCGRIYQESSQKDCSECKESETKTASSHSKDHESPPVSCIHCKGTEFFYYYK